MKIYVNKISNENIYFSTEYGKAKGIWKGADKPREKEYYVEVDIEKKCKYDDMFVCGKKAYQINIFDKNIQLTLLFLEYDEYGCATLKLGDSLIEMETYFDERFYSLKNLFVTIYVEQLYVYDINL